MTDDTHKNLCTRPFITPRMGGSHYISNVAVAPGLEQCVEKGVGPVKARSFHSVRTSSNGPIKQSKSLRQADHSMGIASDSRRKCEETSAAVISGV